MCVWLQVPEAAALDAAASGLNEHVSSFSAALAAAQPRLQALTREHSKLAASLEPEEQALRLQLQLLRELQTGADAAVDAKRMEHQLLSVSVLAVHYWQQVAVRCATLLLGGSAMEQCGRQASERSYNGLEE